jgi:hypothetical protein
MPSIRPVIIAAGVLLTAAACGGSASPGAASGPPAQCPRATSAAGYVSKLAGYYTSVATAGDLVSAGVTASANSSLTGTEASDLAHINAAEAGAPVSLATPLRRLASDYQALQGDLAVAGGQNATTVARDANAVVSDAGTIASVCR